MGRADDLARTISGFETKPIRRIKRSPSRPVFQISYKTEAPLEAKDAINTLLVDFPAKWDGKYKWDGTALWG